MKQVFISAPSVQFGARVSENYQNILIYIQLIVETPVPQRKEPNAEELQSTFKENKGLRPPTHGQC